VSESGGRAEAAALATSLTASSVGNTISTNLGIVLAPDAVAVSNALFPPLPPPAAPPAPPAPPPAPPPPSPPPPTPPPPVPPPTSPPMLPPMLPPIPPLPPTPTLPPASPPPYPPPPTSTSIISASLSGVLGVSGATLLMGVLAYLLWSRWRRRKQRDQTKRSYAAPAPRVHSPAPRPGLRQLDGTRAEPRDSPISVKMSHSPFRQSSVQVSPAPTPSPSLGAATNAARFVTRVDPSGRERTGGVERFTTTSPNHRRRSLDAQGRPTDGGGGVTCATRVRTVVSPPSSSDAMGRYAAQPSRAGDASSPSELRPRPKRAPPLDANTSGAPSGAGASSTPPGGHGKKPDSRSREPVGNRLLANCEADSDDFLSSSGAAVGSPSSAVQRLPARGSGSGAPSRETSRPPLQREASTRGAKPPPPPGLDDYLESLPA
jgi:hypothetical protein